MYKEGRRPYSSLSHLRMLSITWLALQLCFDLASVSVSTSSHLAYLFSPAETP